MSTPTPPQPDFPPPLPPEPPAAPKKSRTNAIIIGSAVAVIAAIVATGIVVVNSGDDDSSPAAEASTPADSTVTAAADEPEPEPTESQPEVMGLTDGVAYEDGVEVTLSGYKRGTSSEYAAPASTEYVAFTVKIDNKSDGVVDVGTGFFMCYYGDASSQAEQIFDPDRNLENLPTMRLRPGRKATTTVACEMPKKESYLQVELTPSMESQTAIFAGDVK